MGKSKKPEAEPELEESEEQKEVVKLGLISEPGFVLDGDAGVQESYVGEFREVTKGGEKRIERHGQGAAFRASPRPYLEGEWAFDEMVQGTFRAASGAVYVGDFRAGVFHGQGTYTWPDGARYQGAWNGSKMHGEGFYEDARGARYPPAGTGTFVDGKYDSGVSGLVELR
mmetsp:Transcript_7088/g.20716  ORF Transcript_7088/g.20716 Transcript_7088/m.20716 type:complete len:170 (-) Transcript_7088:250-759(-)